MSNLKSYVWVTLNEVKEALDITTPDSDARLNGYINRATDMIENYCQRKFLSAAYTDEEYQGNGTYYLTLRNFPVTALTAVSFRTSSNYNAPNWDAISSNDFDIVSEGKTNAGRIASNFGFPIGGGTNNFKVTYTAGYAIDDIPGDLKEALVELVNYFFTNSKINPAMKSETLGNYSYTRDTAGIKNGLIKTLGLDSILDMFRSIPV